MARWGCWYKMAEICMDTPNNVNIITEYSRNMITIVTYNDFLGMQNNKKMRP